MPVYLYSPAFVRTGSKGFEAIDHFGGVMVRGHRGGRGVWTRWYLRFDKDQIYEENDKVVLNVFVAEAPTLATHRQPDVVTARLVPCTRILRP